MPFPDYKQPTWFQSLFGITQKPDGWEDLGPVGNKMIDVERGIQQWVCCAFCRDRAHVGKDGESKKRFYFCKRCMTKLIPPKDESPKASPKKKPTRKKTISRKQ